jgi:NosR/NirI family nitrous oxide reductase transcriptional regulator
VLAQPTPDARPRPSRWRQLSLHGVRVLLFALILAVIHFQHRQVTAERRHAQPSAKIDLKPVQEFFPAATTVLVEARSDGGRDVLDADGNALGYVLQTSPQCDDLIGFSGPTNTLIALSNADQIIGVKVLSSQDTKSHVRQVVQNEKFMNSLDGLLRQQAANSTSVDAVSGATLTSLAIREAMLQRLRSGINSDERAVASSRKSLRFPDPLTTETVKPLFPNVAIVEQDSEQTSRWQVLDKDQKPLGSVLRTSPHADNVIGYQGPTETLIGFDLNGSVLGIWLGKSYDNQPYVSYVAEDEYDFLTRFNDKQIKELAALDLEAEGIEGVSGATMTSMAVAKGIVLAAAQEAKENADSPQKETEQISDPNPDQRLLQWKWRDLGTVLVIVTALLVAFTSLRGKKEVRVGLQIVVVAYLGLINGDLISQAMFVGWAQNGVPWSKAGGLLMLTLAALLVPITTGRNAYCTHVCPHGAAQQLLKNRLPWKLKLPVWLTRVLKLLPAALLVWCVAVPLLALPFSLIDIEPFDAYVLRVAGWATIVVAILGLIASLFIPMAYCRFGCPTGAVLGFLRLNAHSDRWGRRDWFAIGLFGLAVGIALVN